MKVQQSNLVSKYLEDRKKEGSIVQVHLVNGVRLVGHVKDYDEQWIKIAMPQQRATVVNISNVTSFSLGAPKEEEEQPQTTSNRARY